MKAKIWRCGIGMVVAALWLPREAAANGPPSVSGATAALVNLGSVAVGGSVMPNGLGTSVQVQYGPTTNYGNTTPAVFVSPSTATPGTNLPHFLTLNGLSQNAVVSGFGNVMPTNEITVEFWQRANAIQAQSTFCLSPDFPTNRFNAHLPYSDGYVYWDFGNIIGDGRLSYGPLGVVGSWNHFALVVSQSANLMLIYRNGVLEDATCCPSQFRRYAADLLLGSSTLSGGFFNGSLSEFRIWNAAISQSNIVQWMNVPLTPQHPAWTNLLAYWPMNEGSGTNLNDLSGHGHPGNLIQGATWFSEASDTRTIHFTVTNLPPASVTHFQLVVSNSAGIVLGQDIVVTNSPFELINTALPGALFPAAAFGDLFNSGRQDLLLAGAASGVFNQPQAGIWQNTGGGQFSQLPGFLTAVSTPSIALADFDHSGRIDILIAGLATMEGTNLTPVTQLWRNLGNGQFTNVFVGWPGTFSGSIAVADFDNDGLVDVLLTGASQVSYPAGMGAPVTQLWRNEGGGSFRLMASLTPVMGGSVAAVDLDNDGRVDVLLTGATDNPAYQTGVAEVWRNNGNWNFTKVANFAGLSDSSVAVADFDNDGLPDIAMKGYDTNGYLTASVWRNLGNDQFTNLNANLPPTGHGGLVVVDANNDGWPDLLLTGMSTNGLAATELLLNQGDGSFADAGAMLPGALYGTAAAADFLGQGRPGFLIAGGTDSYNPFAELVSSYFPNTNTPPDAPAGLAALPGVGTSVTLSWNAAADAQTPTTGLTYNLRIGTTPGGVDVVSPESDPVSGKRLLQRPGNCGQALSRTLNLPVPGTLYWSVQAVDSAFAGSPFAAEGQITVGEPSVSTGIASPVSFTEALLHGSVIPTAGITTAYFQWGQTTNFGNFTAPQTLPPDTNAAALVLIAAPLSPGTTYYYQLVASNQFGRVFGSTLSFTTPVHQPPSLSGFANVSVPTNSTTGPLAFTIGDAQLPADQLIVTAMATDPNLVPDANLQLGGSGTNRTLTVLTTNVPGVAAIFVSVSDGLATTTKGFVLTVTTNSTHLPPAPKITGIVPTTNGVCVLRYNAAAGYNYTLQSSTDLVHWVDAALGVVNGSAGQFTFTNASRPSRQFFRLRYP